MYSSVWETYKNIFGNFPSLLKTITLDGRSACPALIVNRISLFYELANIILDFIFYEFVKKYTKQYGIFGYRNRE